MKQVNLRLDDELHARLVAAAKRNHRSLNGQIEAYCEHGVLPAAIVVSANAARMLAATFLRQADVYERLGREQQVDAYGAAAVTTLISLLGITDREARAEVARLYREVKEAESVLAAPGTTTETETPGEN